MNILVACEFSGIVRDALRRRGHEAWSCDLLGPDEMPDEFRGQEWQNYHLEGDVRWWLDAKAAPVDRWDMMIAFPPCTHLASSGARWFPKKQKEQKAALAFVRELMAAPIEKIAIENPIGVISSKIRKPEQIIQPWQFGHGETKATCLWLKNLPPLKPTKIVSGRVPRVHHASPGPNRWIERSRTLPGIAQAMAEQWA